MSDVESSDSNASMLLLQTLTLSDTDASDSENNSTTSTPTPEEQLNFIAFVKQASKVLKINSPEYNAILNHEVDFPFDTPIGTPNSEEPTLDLMERLMKRFSFICSAYFEHRESGELKKMKVISGTIHQVSFWSFQKTLGPCLFEITAQVVGLAKKDPSLPSCEGNEINLLLRDIVKRDPVIQVVQPYYVEPKIPRLRVGYMVRCIGVMLDTHLMQALRVTIASHVPSRRR